MKKIKGTQDADRLVGDKDDNILIGRGGDDVLLGRAGNDEIRGGSGDDKINAGSGDDTIKTGGGDDTVRAGQGNDTLIVNGGSSIDAKMGAGDDTVIIEEDAAGGTIRLGKGNDTVEFHASTQTNAEFIIVGGEGVDTFKFVGDQDSYTVEIPEDGNTLIVTDANGNVYKFEGSADAVTFNDVPLVAPTAPVDPDPVDPDPVTPPTGGGGTGGGPIIIDPPFANSYGDLENVFTDGSLYAGGGNPSTGFAKSVNTQAGIELGLDVRYRYNAAEIAPNDGANTWHVSAEDLGNLRFAYSAAADQGLANYDIRLSIDTDGSEEENFLELDLGANTLISPYSNNANSIYDWYNGGVPKIVDDGGDALGHVTQNIQALQWYQQGGLSSLEAGDEFVIKLEAFQQGTDTVLADAEVTIKIDGRTERAVEDFDGDSALVVTEGGNGNIGFTPEGTALMTQSGGEGAADGSGPFTRFDGYRTDSPDIVTTSVDIKISPDDIASGEGFEYTVAANSTSNTHIRDFVFHVANNGSGIQVSASNNAGGAPANMSGYANKASLSDGWYTFQHTMYENASGDLEVNLAVIDRDTGTQVFSQILSDTADDFANFGGNRYGWFAEIDVSEGLEIDNWGVAAQYFDPIVV